ncbi:MAG TPA: potassium-transporting ATPase subunit KdpC [Pirellulaceae bacterium]|jgi:K+-transporting ATPase ATPase C chain
MLSDLKKELGPAVVLFVLLTILTGVIYPLAVTGVAAVAFPSAAIGSLLVDQDGQAIGSRLIGQPFDDPKYFWSRPSATGPFGYNAGASSGSNLGPLNEALAVAVKNRVANLQSADPSQQAAPPIDLVTASGSGLDPHISPAGAYYQISRVATARGLSEDRVTDLVKMHIEARTFGILGEPRVNVLALNLALDELR